MRKDAIQQIVSAVAACGEVRLVEICFDGKIVRFVLDHQPGTDEQQAALQWLEDNGQD